MKAIVQDRFGPPDVLRLADTDLPEAGAERRRCALMGDLGAHSMWR